MIFSSLKVQSNELSTAVNEWTREIIFEGPVVFASKHIELLKNYILKIPSANVSSEGGMIGDILDLGNHLILKTLSTIDLFMFKFNFQNTFFLLN